MCFRVGDTRYVKIGKCKFSDKWIQDEKYSAWLQKTKEYEVDPIVPNLMKLGTMGCKSLDAHMKEEKHNHYSNSQTTAVSIQMFAALVYTASANNNITPTLVSSGPCTSNAFSTFSSTATLKAKMQCGKLRYTHLTVFTHSCHNSDFPS